jgi:hypothetical protein
MGCRAATAIALVGAAVGADCAAGCAAACTDEFDTACVTYTLVDDASGEPLCDAPNPLSLLAGSCGLTLTPTRPDGSVAPVCVHMTRISDAANTVTVSYSGYAEQSFSFPRDECGHLIDVNPPELHFRLHRR